MTYQEHCPLPESLLEQIAEQGFDVLAELVRISPAPRAKVDQ